MSVYFTADSHFGHANIIKHCDRPFESVEKMYEEIIARLEALYKNVEDFNKREAKQHYGDALLDLDFAFGKSDCCSLYVSHYIKY